MEYFRADRRPLPAPVPPVLKPVTPVIPVTNEGPGGTTVGLPAAAPGGPEDEEAVVPTEQPEDADLDEEKLDEANDLQAATPAHTYAVPTHVAFPDPLPAARAPAGRTRPKDWMGFVPACPWPFNITVCLMSIGLSNFGEQFPYLVPPCPMPVPGSPDYDLCMGELQRKVSCRIHFAIVVDSRALLEEMDAWDPLPSSITHNGSHPQLVESLSKVAPLMHRVLRSFEHQMRKTLKGFCSGVFVSPMHPITVVVFDNLKGEKWASAVRTLLTLALQKQAYQVCHLPVLYSKCQCVPCTTSALTRKEAQASLKAMSEGFFG